MKISEHITFDEATISHTAIRLRIDNTPTAEIIENMKLVAVKCFEPLRKWYGKPIKINSFYRSVLLNKAIGGSPTSDHVKGCSIDLTGGSKDENKKIYDWCKANLIFDQLINEYDYTWVHISFKKGMNRNQSFDIK